MNFYIPSSFTLNLPSLSRDSRLILKHGQENGGVVDSRFSRGQTTLCLLDYAKDFDSRDALLCSDSPATLVECYKYRDNLGQLVYKNLYPASICLAFALFEHPEVIPAMFKGFSRLYFLGSLVSADFFMKHIWNLVASRRGREIRSQNKSIKYDLQDRGLPFTHLSKGAKYGDSFVFLYFDDDNQQVYLDFTQDDTVLTPYDRLVYVYNKKKCVSRVSGKMQGDQKKPNAATNTHPAHPADPPPFLF